MLFRVESFKQLASDTMQKSFKLSWLMYKFYVGCSYTIAHWTEILSLAKEEHSRVI